MKTLKALALAAGVFALTPAFAADHHAGGAYQQDAKSIVEIAVGNDDFSTLVAALQAGDLVETLGGEGPFTVFAPTNAAFAALPEGTVANLLLEENKPALQMVLTYHVVAGAVKAADLIGLIGDNDGEATIETVEGTALTARIREGAVVLEDTAGRMITVVTTDIEASNGVIHVVDGVLLPTAE